jgi:CRISPR system Cascade subunit CasD
VANVIIRLEGPLQAFGCCSISDVRDTHHIPTKSAVVGILAACMGIHDDKGVIGISRSIAVMDVRVDRPGMMMVDYQTVRNSVMAGRTTGPKLRDAGIVSHRYYLADASFRVAISTLRADEFNAALQDPVCVPYLGRACCTPTAPLYMEHIDPDPEGSIWWIECGPKDGVMVRDNYLSYEARSFLPRFMCKLT